MKHHLSRYPALALLLCVPLITGCLGRTPAPKLYLLTPLNSGAASPADAGMALGVGPVTIPEYLQRSQIVTRGACPTGAAIDCGQLQVAELERWAEPLDENLARVLSENLSMLLATERVEHYPWRPQTRIDYQVRVDVIRLGADSQASLLTARWSILSKDGELLVVKRSNFREPSASGDYGSMVNNLSRALAQLSREVATELKKLGTPISKNHQR